MPKYNFWLAMLLPILVAACKHHPDVVAVPAGPIREDCVSIPAPNMNEYQTVNADSFFYNIPYVNPNNPNELVILEVISGTVKLITVNFVTGERHILFIGESSFGIPTWAKSNWIVTERSDNQVWKIRPDGSSLTRISHGDFEFAPLPNYSGDSLLYTSRYPVGNGHHFRYILALLDGTTLDTLQNVGSTGSWNHPFFRASQGNNEFVAISDVKADTGIVILPMKNYGHGITWVSDTEVVWSESEGLYRGDVVSKHIDTLRVFCDAIRYDNPSYSPQIDKVYWHKRKRYWVDSTTVAVKNWIVRMNPDGTEEEIIEIPR